MAFDVKTLVLTSLLVSLLLAVALAVAVYLAKVKRDFLRHCTVIRVVLPVELLTIGVVMVPSLVGYLQHARTDGLFLAEILLHHTFGLGVILLWVYINLVFLGAVRLFTTLVTLMRLALVLWVLALVMGVHMYVRLWL
ncbi:MAG: hypothetical protein HYX92_06975 [Chloroflexi bacterium]|nr:hypothetical protein [Chloroflexota bacterium]